MLQWTKTLDPYWLNFIEYRKVRNVTQSVSGLDFSAYQTLPVSFDSEYFLIINVPNAWLEKSTFYEFRMVYPFARYTSRTNTLAVKTFGAMPRLVSNLRSESTASSISLNWSPPEFGSSLVGYDLRVFQGQPVAGLLRREAAANDTLIARLSLPLTQSSLAIDCNALNIPCLIAYTQYRITIAAVRELGTDEPFTFVTSTRETAPDFSPSITVAQIEHEFVDVCVGDLSSRFGLIAEIQFQVQLVATDNDAVVPTDFNTTFQWRSSGDPCTLFRLEGIYPLTVYVVAARVSTVAGFGPFSTPLEVSTGVFEVSEMVPPDITLLGQQELRRLGWKRGYLISWRAPAGLEHEFDLLRYDVVDTGVFANGSVIYSGVSTSHSVQRVFGKIRVRAVTVGGIGNFTEGVDASALVSKSQSTNIIPIVVPSVLVFVLLSCWSWSSPRDTTADTSATKSDRLIFGSAFHMLWLLCSRRSTAASSKCHAISRRSRSRSSTRWERASSAP